ncbi:MAG: hypothetical protein KDC98_08985 [Planctomycetes bacterium]|nr:hypothetical protein [Planctomycetota bacterium]
MISQSLRLSAAALFVVVGTGCKLGVPPRSADPALDVSAEAVANARVVVTFFGEADPCQTTTKVEKMCRQAVESGFATELASGALVYRVLCNTLPENDHFIDDYEIGEKALVVARQQDGKEIEFVPCHDIWLTYEDPADLAAFNTGVQQPIREFLRKN